MTKNTLENAFMEVVYRVMAQWMPTFTLPGYHHNPNYTQLVRQSLESTESQARVMLEIIKASQQKYIEPIHGYN
ncbi:MAG: hypothetical protein ACR2NY_02705, partial [Alphaproteobacteria bacterium]